MEADTHKNSKEEETEGELRIENPMRLMTVLPFLLSFRSVRSKSET